METLKLIGQNAENLLHEIPADVTLLAAAKTRTPEEVRVAWEAGIRCFGHNYVQEAQTMLPQLDFRAEWHMIGHLQRNKADLAVSLFDLVETLDSPRLARALEKHCAGQEKVLPVYIEINSGREENKDGALPEDVDALAELIGTLPHLRLQGLMTMGPLTGDAELSRPYFKTTREIFDRIKRDNPEMRWLSMG